MTAKMALVYLFVELLLMQLSTNLSQGLVHQDAFQQVNSDLTQIKAELVQMNGVLTATMNQVHAVTAENQLLNSIISEMQVELGNSQTFFSELQRNHSLTETALEMKVSDLEDRLNGVGSVVFMLQFKDKWVSNISDNAVLKYDDLVLNVGGGYDPTTGIFTCPKAGLYLISVRCSNDVMAFGKSAVWAIVQRNHRLLLECVADDNHDESDFVQISVNLDEGDQLLVTQTYSNVNEFAGGIWTFFSGILLVPKVD